MRRAPLFITATFFYGLMGFSQEIVQNFTMGSTAGEGISDKNIYCITEDLDGNIWVGTEYGGLNKWDGITWAHYDYSNGMPASKIYDLEVGSDGRVWAGTANGIVIFDQDQIEIQTYENGEYPTIEAYDILIDHQDSVWAATYSLVLKFGPNGWRIMRETTNSLFILEDSEGTIWARDGNHLSYLKNGTWFTLGTSDGLPSTEVYGMAEDQYHEYWFNTAAGLYKWDGSTWERVDENFLPYDVRNDLNGNLYASMSDGTVRKYDGTDYTVVAEGAYRSFRLYIAGDGKIYIGRDTELMIVDQGTVTHLKPQPGLISNFIYDVFIDEDGTWWIGTDRGYCIYDGINWSAPGFPESSNLDVYQIEKSDDGKIWMATRYGLYIFDVPFQANQYTRLTMQQGLPADRISNIRVIQNDEAWISTNNGASHFINGMFTNYSTDDGLINFSVNDIWVKKDGSIWFATAGGISKLSNGIWTNWTTVDGLPHNLTYQLIEDQQGTIYVATFHGAAYYEEGQWTQMHYFRTFDFIEDKENKIWMTTAFNPYRLRIIDPSTKALTNLEFDYAERHTVLGAITYDEAHDQLIFGTTGEGIVVADISNVISGVQRSETRSLTIYPNPANTQITLGLPYEAQGKLEFYIVSTQGQIVNRGIVYATFTNTEIPVASLPAGIYMIEVRNNSNRWIGKLSILH